MGLNEGLKERRQAGSGMAGHPAELGEKRHEENGYLGYLRKGGSAVPERKNREDEEAVVGSCPSCDLQEDGGGEGGGGGKMVTLVRDWWVEADGR